jgi:hypothetical protein
MGDRILSPSEINCFRNCRQQWLYSYIERRPRTRSGPARRVGTIVHAGLAGWYEWKELEECYKILQAAGKKHEHYILHYADDRDFYEPVIIEKKITASKVALKAIPDLLTLYLPTEKYVVIDHKVQASLDIDKAFDTQKVALFKVLNEDYKVDAIMYNLLKSSIPLVPEPIQAGTRFKKFEPGSTTEAVFLSAVKRNKFNKKDYPDALKFFKENDNPFFKRVFVSISMEELEEFEEEVATVREQIGSGIIYRNRQWDCERSCDFYDICFEQDKKSKTVLKGGMKCL